MELVRLWKFLHIASMFGAVSAIAGAALVSYRVVRTGHVAAIRRTLAAERRVQNVIATPLFFGGILFGFITALTSGFELTAPWLVTAYVLLGINFANAMGPWERHAKRLIAAAEASGETRPSPELQALIDSPRSWLVVATDIFLWFAIIFVMVVKPFS
jgi:uncharacterized membrane protein